jgi:hypothetical protein
MLRCTNIILCKPTVGSLERESLPSISVQADLCADRHMHMAHTYYVICM